MSILIREGLGNSSISAVSLITVAVLLIAEVLAPETPNNCTPAHAGGRDLSQICGNDRRFGPTRQTFKVTCEPASVRPTEATLRTVPVGNGHMDRRGECGIEAGTVGFAHAAVGPVRLGSQSEKSMKSVYPGSAGLNLVLETACGR